MSKPLVFKVNLVGEMAVGKTSIFLRLKDDRFVENMSTITIDRGKIDFEVNGKAVQVCTAYLSIHTIGGWLVLSLCTCRLHP